MGTVPSVPSFSLSPVFPNGPPARKLVLEIRLQQPIEKLDVNELVSDGRLRVAEHAGNHGVSLKATPQPNPPPQDKSPP